MRDLSHKRERFYSVSNNYSLLYNYTNQREQLTISAGVLNFVWNHWNNFWREFWLAHVSGGTDFNGDPITPIYPNYTDKQSCHFLLYACGKRRNHNTSDTIIGVFQEATWGDPDIITNIATTLIPNHTYMSYVLALLSHYNTILQHFQRIRNSFIHLNNENVYQLNSLTGYYTFAPNQRLIDILETINISTSNRCFDTLIDNMNGMLSNL